MPPTPTMAPDEIQLGPGRLYIASLGTADPSSSVSAVSALASGWHEVGYTDEGSTFEFSQDFVGIPVAEELEPIRYVPQGVEYSLGFAMKQSSRRTLGIAMNMGVLANDGSPISPPKLGEEVRIKILFYSEAGARWFFPRCFQGTNVSITRNKAPNVALLPVLFHVERPSTGEDILTVYPTASGLI